MARAGSKSNFLWFALIPLALFCAVANAERLPVKTYTVADGILRDNVVKIKQDSRGFLWFCTNDGVSRFDGYGFTNFTVADGLPDRHARDFLETMSGEILIATENGLAKLNAVSKTSRFAALAPENPKAKDTGVLFEDKNASIFVGTADGLLKLRETGEFETIIPSVSVTAIIEDRRGWLWIGTENGLFKVLPDGSIEKFTTGDGLPETNITSLLEDKNGRVWVGFRPRVDAGVARLVENPQKNQNIVERVFTNKDGLPSVWVTDLRQMSDGRLWVATIQGLCLWREGEVSVCKTYTGANDLCDRETWTIAEDKDDNLWLGTRCGAKKIARYGFTAYDEANGTKNTAVNSIFENAAGELFASYNDGEIRTVSRFDGEKFETVKPNFPREIGYFGWGNRHTVWQDETGDWWFPTAYGLYKFPRPAQFRDLATAAPQKIAENLKDRQIFRLFEDSRGDFWIASFKTVGEKTVNELWLWERTANNWRDLTNELDIGDEQMTTSFAEDKYGSIWIGTGSNGSRTALIRYGGGRFDVFTKDKNEMLAGEMMSLFVDSKNRLWAANTTLGLLRLDDVNAAELSFTRYTPAEGLSTIGVITVTEDAYGRIYIGTARGIDRLTPETGQIEHFTTADGLPASFVETSFRDRQNNLWFGTDKGIARFTPEPKRTRRPPNVLITALRVSGVAQAVSVLGETQVQNLELNSDQRQVTVDFLGLGANLGERLKYEYRLDNTDWTATDERTLNFANLSAGDYSLEIRAETADRIYSQTPARVSFRIAAPVWQRWWFLLSAAALVGFVTYLIYKSRLRRLLELEKVRIRIATDLHDDIGSNLTKISIMSEVARRIEGEKQGEMLRSIADISRISVSSMGDIVWAINPKKDSFLELVRRMRSFAETTLDQVDISLEFNAPEISNDLNLDADVRRNIYLIFKESLNNIVRHSRAQTVKIDLEMRQSNLVLTVTDDGKGLKLNGNADGNGLANMKRRADDLRGKFEVVSPNGKGAKVILEVPLN
jgi:ligand-binding sensor domain-containing protein/signal transduction histidine kinase